MDAVARDRPMAARSLARRIMAAARALGELPAGRPGRVMDTYEKVLPGLPWFIVYEITLLDGRETVHVLRVIHAARDWPEGSTPD
jgi:toxin ParE1/3/4